MVFKLVIMASSQRASPTDARPKMQFVDLRATYNLDLVQRFYSDIIMANFPIEDERDDLEWFQNGLRHTAPEYLDPKDPLLFVVIAVAPAPRGPDEQYDFEDCTSSNVDPSLPIAGAIAFEYFKHSNCGLVTYIVTQPIFNRKGIARRLMELAYEKLNQVRGVWWFCLPHVSMAETHFQRLHLQCILVGSVRPYLRRRTRLTCEMV